MNSRKPWPASALKAHAPSPGAARHPLPSNGRGLSDRTAPPQSPWLPSTTGKKIDLLYPTVDMVDLADIAASLAKIARWTGKTVTAPFSVAQHSVFVSRLVTQTAAPYALLHDAHEAFTGDITSPMKAAIRALLGAPHDPLRAIETGFDHVIFVRFGLAWPMPAHIRAAVKFADLQALATERRDLTLHVPAHDADWAAIGLPPPVAHTRIRPLSWDRAEEQFIARFHELFGGME